MRQSVKGALVGALVGCVVWAGTGAWQVFALTMVGVVCTWLFAPPRPAQQRRHVRVEIRGIEAACYDYGGCRWAGDGCSGRPVVLGPGRGCMHC